MGRVFKVELRRGGVSIVVDLSGLLKLIGVEEEASRAEEAARRVIGEVVERCLSRFKVSRSSSLLYEEVFCHGASPYDYGRICRCIEDYERELRSKLSARRHVFFTFFTDKPLTNIQVAVYKVEEKLDQPHLVTGRLCRAVERIYGYTADRIGANRLVFPLSGGEELPESLRIDAADVSVSLRLEGVKVLDPSIPREANCLKRLLSRAVKARLRLKGFTVKGLKAFWRDPAVEDEKVEVRRGFEFSVLVFSDGEAALALSPRSEVSSKMTLWEEYGCSPDRLKASSRRLHGRAAKRIYDGSVIRILGVEDATVGESLGQSVSVIGRYESLGLLAKVRVAEGEPTVVGLSRGVVVHEAPSALKLIYTLRDLKKMGASSKVISFLHSPPQTWLEAAKELLKAIGTVELDGETISFVEEPPEVELL
ncbi:MAG: hypothetical protein DRJ68_05445 [Thermoprotei archaeon]|nr:MAG: hypothetical protein DRJ68_05445 [Thermoprotei archaeon]